MSRLAADHPMQLVLGLSAWAVWFVVVYGGLSVACAVAPPAARLGAFNAVNGVLGLITLATTALLGYAAWRCGRAARHLPGGEDSPRRRFIAAAGAALHVIAAVSTAFVGLPLLVLPPCV